jgi:hypothetical protein
MTLIFLGGVSRAGKSTAARWVARRAGLPVEGLDRHVVGLARGDGFIPQGRARVLPAIEAQLIAGHHGVVEGSWLLPEPAAALRDRFGDAFVPLFCGYPQADAAARDVMLMATAPEGGDWYSRQDRAARLAVLDQQIALSRRHQAACAALGLPFVDVSDPATGLQVLRRTLLDLTRAAAPVGKEKGRSQGPARLGADLIRLIRGYPGTAAGT